MKYKVIIVICLLMTMVSTILISNMGINRMNNISQEEKPEILSEAKLS